MSARFSASLSASIIVLAATLAPVSGQTPAKATKTATTKTWTAPLTPYGHPDLQGVWQSNSATPLERPKALEGKAFLTDDEVTELKRRAARLFGAGMPMPPAETMFSPRPWPTSTSSNRPTRPALVGEELTIERRS
jgi:hypothetical protein